MLSYTTTDAPLFNSTRAREEPMKPAPPVTTQRWPRRPLTPGSRRPANLARQTSLGLTHRADDGVHLWVRQLRKHRHRHLRVCQLFCDGKIAAAVAKPRIGRLQMDRPGIVHAGL